jgi:dihydrofolate reductase
MGRVIGGATMSLDGCIAGPNGGAGNPLGDGGARLHAWMTSPTERDRETREAWTSDAGAVIVGRRMFDEGEGPWGDEPPWHLPVLILTHRARPAEVKQGGTTYTFVTDGIESALRQARAVAGDNAIVVAGGAATIAEYVRAGLLDELVVHIAPVLLGAGLRLFDTLGPGPIELEPMRMAESPGAAHLRYRVGR